MQALHAAKLGLMAQQNRVNIIAGNISNVNTTGYKGQRMDFKDALYTQILNPADLQQEGMMQGTGVLTGATNRDLNQGSVMNTGVSLDFYINGDGYFTLSNASGTVMYTRNGAFGVSVETDGRYLVNGNGDYVLDDQSNRIRLPEGATDIEAGTDGTLSADGVAFARLNIVTFTNRNGLSSAGDTCFMETVASGAPINSEASVVQGALEGSNVDLAVELTRLIRAQKAFALAGKAVSTWDQMEATTNNLRT